METIIKINYAPNTIFIVGELQKAEIKVLNSKNTRKNQYGQLQGVTDHCNKCKEQILSKLN